MAQFIAMPKTGARRIHYLTPKDGKRFSQEEVRAMFLMAPQIAERGGRVIFVEGAGKEAGLRFNLLATLAIEDRNVYGNALICAKNEAPI